MREISVNKLFAIGHRAAAAVVALTMAFAVGNVGAATPKGPTTLYSFSAAQFPGTAITNFDGAAPATPLILARDGNFYGVTPFGGTAGSGTIFSVNPSNGLTPLYQFPPVIDIYGQTNTMFGPNALVQGTNGFFCGTTQTGGTNRNGTIYQMSPLGRVTSLYTFSLMHIDTNANDAAFGAFTNLDGANPAGPLALGADGNFYGVTQQGGTNGTGTIFELTPFGQFTCLYSFSALNSSGDNTEGASPNGLTPASDGSLYGTAETGGQNGFGALYRFTPGAGVTPLYSCASVSNSPAGPKSLLTVGADGNLYGTSSLGGVGGSGTIYQVTLQGAVNVLYSFAPGDDGGDSGSALVLGPGGILFGTSENDGTNGNGTLYEMTPSEFFASLYSFSALNSSMANSEGANPFGGLTAGMDGYIYGSCSEGGANGNGTIFRFSPSAIQPSGDSPSISKPPPAKAGVLYGSSLTISAQANGAPPLYCQWIKNGAALTDGGDLAGVTTLNLVVSPAQSGDAGSYAVVVTNTFGATTSAVCAVSVLADTTIPLVTITSPKAGVRTNAPIFSGTASDNADVLFVSCWLSNAVTHATLSNTATMSAGSKGSSNWTVSFDAPSGTNTFSVQSVDYSGNKSKVASVNFFKLVPAQIGVVLAGDPTAKFTGTAAVKGDATPTNNAILNLGESYTLTTAPSAGFLFSNWMSGDTVLSNGPALKFVMSSNLVLTANFVPNFFIGAAGIYNGLFYPSNGVAEENSGMLSDLKLGTNGVYSAKLLLAGKPYSVMGQFNVSGQAQNAAGASTLFMTLAPTGGQITGTVSNAAWSSDLTADKASSALPNAEYTMLFAPTASVTANSPPGEGYALVTNHSGTFTISGALADGTKFSQAVPSSPSGDLPVYASLYANTGLLLGWINATNLAAAAPTNQLAWIKKPARSGIYPAGFTNILSTSGGIWIALPPLTPAIDLTSGQLTISNSALALDYTFAVTNNDSLVKLAGSPTNSLTGSIAAKTGLLTLAFGDGKGKGTLTATGAVVQGQTNGGGYFLTSTNAGLISISP